jgi:thiamine biosynthesis protein ThiS
MKILLNNRSEELQGEPISVSDMLLQKKFSYKMRIIKINGTLISKDKYDTTNIYDGDDVQMIYLMSGG